MKEVKRLISDLVKVTTYTNSITALVENRAAALGFAQPKCIIREIVIDGEYKQVFLLYTNTNNSTYKSNTAIGLLKQLQPLSSWRNLYNYS